MTESWIQTLTIIGVFGAGFGFLIGWLRAIDKDISAIDNRLSRMEGYLQGRDYKFNGTEDKT